ncbi:MAG TPA: large conductance mechanosensitive channel protein MscL [Ktedonobacteraceae bacterium]|nr:large conductance mechanosensitive channel protein MscL [Ktedonobacteraceae bacterium]
MSSEDHPNFRQNLNRVGGYTKDTFSGFRAFILRGNVVDLAVGIVIGAAFTAVVNGLVNNVITPLIPVPGGSLGGLQWQVPWAKAGVVVNLSTLLNAIISFVIVAAVLYFFIVRPVNALVDRYKPKEETPVTTRDCPYCLQAIPLKATRCAYCTSVVVEAQTAETAPPRA